MCATAGPDAQRASVEDVALHWQQWRLRSATLDRVRDAVLTAAHRELGRAG